MGSDNAFQPLLSKYFHIAFWVMILAFLLVKDLQLFSYGYAVPENLLYLSALAGVFYFSYFKLLPFYTKTSSFFWLFVAIVATGLVGVFIVYFVLRVGYFNAWNAAGLPILKNPVEDAVAFRPVFNFRILLDGVIIGFYIVAGLQLRLVEDWVLAKQRQNELENQQLRTELDLLKMQVSPHFLFNTLNNLYALAMKNDGQTAPSLMKLSGMMRYMLYESEEEKVPIAQEVEYIQNYLELQKLRLAKQMKVGFVAPEPLAPILIPPLLLAPIIENAFKHGIPLEGGGFVNFVLTTQKRRLEFQAKNSYGIVQQTGKPSGIGLNNLKKRLELIYPESHSLDIIFRKDYFLLKLSITNP